MVGRDNYTITRPKFQANHYTNICVLSFYFIFGRNMKSCQWLALKRRSQKKVNRVSASCNKLVRIRSVIPVQLVHLQARHRETTYQ
jgi:hypothetical protein